MCGAPGMMQQAAVTRFFALLISCGLAVFHSLPARVVYDCRVTGARNLPACCCKGKTSCCGRSARASSADCCYPSAGNPAGPEPTAPVFPDVVADSCGCCDVTYEEGTPAVSVWREGGEEGSSRLTGFDSLRAPLPGPAAFSFRPPPGSSGPTLARAPPGNDRPLYILFSSLLL